MATFNQTSPRKSRRSVSPGRRRRRWLLLPAAVLAGLAAWYWPTLHGYAITGTSYGARVGCSCRFVGGRSLSDCKKDFEPGMEFVMLSEDASAQSVTARIPLVSSQTATYRPGWGCQLERWKD